MSEVKLPEIGGRGASRGAMSNKDGQEISNRGGNSVQRQNSLGSMGAPARSVFAAKKDRKE